MSAVDFLLTPTVQRVLARTLSHPTRTFTLKDLLDRAATGRGNAQLQVERLLQAGVLREEPRRGRQRSIGANTEHFLYPELRAIARKTFGVVEPIREGLEPFLDRVDEAFVFGSVATDQDTGTSDIDVMVIGAISSLDLLPLTSTLSETLGRSVHFNVYEPAEWQDLVVTDPVIRQIVAGPRLVVLPA